MNLKLNTRSLTEKLLKPASRSLVVGYLASSLCASLMMTPEEVSLLNSVAPDDTLLEISDEIANLTPAVVPDILFLSAILYFNPTHWTVWINDKIYTAEDAEDEQLKLVKVTQHLVELELKDYFKKCTKIRTNQSLVTIGHRIVDGDARQKLKQLQL